MLAVRFPSHSVCHRFALSFAVAWERPRAHLAKLNRPINAINNNVGETDARHPFLPAAEEASRNMHLRLLPKVCQAYQ